MRKLKCLSISLLLLLVLFSSINIKANAFYSGSNEPKVFIENGDLPVATIGDDFKLTLTLTNKSKYGAKEVKVTPQINNDLLELNDLVDYQEVKSLVSNKNEVVSFNFRVKETAKPGVYPLVVDFSYKNYSNNYFGSSDSRRRTIYIKVIDGEAIPEIDVNTVLVSPDNPRAGKESEYRIEVVNKGERTASDIIFSLEDLSPENFTIINGINKRTCITLEGGERTAFNYSLNINKEMKTGVYGLKYKITFNDQFGREYTKESEFYTSVLAKDDEVDDNNRTTPKIILSSYKTAPSIVMAGGNFDLEAAFYNTNKTVAVKNIRITMAMKESSNDGNEPNIFTPVNSTNVVYIDELQPHQSKDCFIAFNVAKNAEVKTYIMELNMEYEDTSGKQYEAQEEIYIRVSQEPNLGIDNINYNQQIGLNEDSWFNAYMFNNSGVDIYNLLVKIEGENIDPAKASHYVGSLKKYSSEGIDTTIRATAEGKITGFVTFTYEDATGKQYEQKKQFDMECVNYYNMYYRGEEEEEPEPTGNPLFKKVLTWVGIALVIIITLVVLLKRRKRLKIKAIEEELINEIMNNQ